MSIKKSFTSTIKTLAEGIEQYIDERLKSASFDTTKQGIITAVLDDNQYSVKIKGTIYTVPSCISDSLQVNDVVLVLCGQNDMKNSCIIGKKGIQKIDGSALGDMLKSVYDSNGNGKVDNAENADRVNGFMVETSVPINAKFTDTIYTHPTNHSPSIITQDANNRFVTDAEKSEWNAKETTAGSQAKVNTHANNVSNPHSVTKSQVGLGNVSNTSDADKPISNATQVALDNKVDKITGKGLSTNDFTSEEKDKLTSIATGATKNDTDVNLKNRANHTGTQISSTISDFANTVRSTVLTGLSTATNAIIDTTDTVISALGKLQKQISDHINDVVKHITSTERTNWNAAYDSKHSHSNKSVLDGTEQSFTSTLKTKLDGIAIGANNYTHPTGDGNSHIPATSTTSENKVLKAGSTENSATWGNVSWNEVTEKPSTYTPSTHGHVIADTTGLQTALDGKAASSHTHSKSQIADMPTKLSQFTNDSDFITASGAPVQSVAGKTGSVSLSKSDIGLGNVDNTSDIDKPISTATQNALNVKLDSSSYSASDILTKLKTVDGSGSELDADTVDGKHTTDLQNYNNLTNKPTIPTNSSFSLSGLNDTGISSPSNSQILQYNGEKWVNTNPQSFSQAQTNWNETNIASVRYIQNKPTSLPANGGTATNSSYFLESDTRNTNENPQWYMTNRGKKNSYEFKTNSVIGLSFSGVPTYSEVSTFTSWGDSSGGYPVQLATNNAGMFYRTASSETTWNKWLKLSSTDIRIQSSQPSNQMAGDIWLKIV